VQHGNIIIHQVSSVIHYVSEEMTLTCHAMTMTFINWFGYFLVQMLLWESVLPNH